MDSPTPTFGDVALQAWREIFARHFEPADSWAPWETVLKLIFGVPLTNPYEIERFQAATGRDKAFDGPLLEAWLLCGRRSGKSRIMSFIAVLLATFKDYTTYLAPGERAVIGIFASDRDQAGVIFGYCRALILGTPMISRMIERETADELVLSNSVTLGVYTSSYRSVRGRTLAAAILDEVAFWRSDDSRNPAAAVITALRPSLSTIPNAPLLMASSVYSKSGALYNAYVRHWGKDASRILCWKSDTITMNPSFRAQIIADAYLADSADAASEYGSMFRTDISAFLSDDDVDEAIVRERRSLPHSMSYQYFAFADLSGGRNDAAALCVAHQEIGGRIVLDRIDTVPAPFNPESVIDRFAVILSAYSLNRVTGDNFAAAFVVDAFAKHGVGYNMSEFSSSEIYIEILPLFTARLVELLDVPVLENELRQLERRPQPGGREKVNHPRQGHDDVAIAACGAMWLASRVSTAMGAETSSITHALRDHDPFAPPISIRSPPRHLPRGFPGVVGPDFVASIRDYDPIS